MCTRDLVDGFEWSNRLPQSKSRGQIMKKKSKVARFVNWNEASIEDLQRKKQIQRDIENAVCKKYGLTTTVDWENVWRFAVQGHKSYKEVLKYWDDNLDNRVAFEIAISDPHYYIYLGPDDGNDSSGTSY